MLNPADSSPKQTAAGGMIVPVFCRTHVRKITQVHSKEKYLQTTMFSPIFPCSETFFEDCALPRCLGNQLQALNV